MADALPPKPAPKVAAAPAPKPIPKPKPKPKESPVVIRALASKAKRKQRHWGLIAAFAIIVLLPVFTTWWYLNERAVDQFASTIGFTVRSEDVSSATDLLGGLGQSFGGGGGSDSDILYEFIRSQALVAQIDRELDLRDYYSRHVDVDPVFGFNPEGTIEDLTAYWQRMVRISYDAGSGLMELRVLAFDPIEARAIANAIFDKSTKMINDLSAIAREDGTRYAREDLELAVERLKIARESLTAFRISSEIVDPTADVAGQMGLLNLLQAQQVEALIEFDLLNNSTREGDPRLEQARRRIDVIEDRIREERQKFGVGANTGDTSYAETIAEFERLAVDREFAEQAYAATLAAFDGARAEANRQSRYLAAYIKPTLAERSEFPNRPLLIAIVGLFSFLGWAIMSLVYYALRDRR
jgi:capsular polysaccharide transport system permease protein